MGIKGLTKFIKTYAPSAIEEITLDDLAGKCLGVDISGFIYQTSYNKEKKGKGNHMRELFEVIVACYDKNIQLLIVFDGSPVKEKQDTMAARHAIKENQLQNLMNLTNKAEGLIDLDQLLVTSGTPEIVVYKTTKEIKDEAREALKNPLLQGEDREALEKHLKNCIHVDPNIFEEIQMLLRLCNVHSVRAKHEADHLLARLCKEGLIYGVLSEDSDMLTHGCPYLIRGFNSTDFKRNGSLLQYSLSCILSETQLDMSQFIDLCILHGCDYTTTIKGIGPKTAYNLIKKGNTIEDILDQIETGKFNKKNGESKYTTEPGFNASVARLGFTYSDLEDPTAMSCYGVLSSEAPAVSQLRSLLLSKTNYTPGTLEKKLDILKSPPESHSQKSQHKLTKSLSHRKKITVSYK